MMIDQKTFLDAIQKGNKDLFEAFLRQESLDDDEIGQGILIALDMGKVDVFCTLVDLYKGSLSDLHNAEGYTFFELIGDAYRKINFEFTNKEGVEKAKADFTLAIQKRLRTLLTENDKDIHGITLRQYLLCSYSQRKTVPETKVLVEGLLGEVENPIEIVASELGITQPIPEGQDPIELYKIKKFIEKNKEDEWKAYLKDLKISLNDTEYDIFLSKIEQESKVPNSLRHFKDQLQEEFLVGPKRDEFFRPINIFFLNDFIDDLNANDDAFFEEHKKQILTTITTFLGKHHKTPIDEYIELFKTAPETAYIYKLYDYWGTILEKGPYHPNVLKMAFKLYFSQGKRDNTKLESFGYYISEAKAYCQMEQDLNNTLSLDQIGKKGKAIKHAYQELMLDVVKDNTPFEKFKRSLIDAYVKKTTPPTEESKSDLTETNTKTINPSAPSTQEPSIFEKFINSLRRWFYGDQKSKLDNFFDNLNKNRYPVFKKEYTKSMLAAKSIFKEPEKTTSPSADGPKVQ